MMCLHHHTPISRHISQKFRHSLSRATYRMLVNQLMLAYLTCITNSHVTTESETYAA